MSCVALSFSEKRQYGFIWLCERQTLEKAEPVIKEYYEIKSKEVKDEKIM